jgi:hypothetical protein
LATSGWIAKPHVTVTVRLVLADLAKSALASEAARRTDSIFDKSAAQTATSSASPPISMIAITLRASR